MNNKALSFLRNFSYTISSNFISLLISTLVILLIPKFIGVEQYGYWQLYIFYSGYVGLLHIGWNDGIYLRYGGKKYKDLDKNLFHSQFYLLLSFQVILFILLLSLFSWHLKDPDRIFVIKMTLYCMMIVNTRYMLLYILQATNKIIEYARITIIEKLIYAFLIIIFILFNITDFRLMILFDLLGKLTSLLYAMYLSKDIVFRSFSSFKFDFHEIYLNISAGIKLMIANFSSKMIIGIVRFGIERAWNVSTFGKVSLTLSISGLVMIFINAVGVILFPILRRSEPKDLSYIYVVMRDILMVLLFSILIIYYPLKELLFSWLPQYADGLVYMSMLFPMLVYEGKTALLINTYLKTIRQEKLMLIVNLTVLLLSAMLTVTFTILFKSLDITILSIIFIVALRSIILELLLSRIIKINIKLDILYEVILTVVFICSAWYIDSFLSTGIYALTFLIYLIGKRKSLKVSGKKLKMMIF